MAKDWFEYDRETQRITVRQGGNGELTITPDDVSVSYFSGGPGGQNVNRNVNGVQMIYKIPENYLHTFQKTRQLVSRSIGQRSKAQNTRQAFDQLAEKIRHYFYIPPERKKTKVPKRSKKKRLQNKKMRGKVKQDRKKVEY
jgi:ribosome-associated protein